MTERNDCLLKNLCYYIRMYRVKKYFVILLLTVFVFGSMAATAMAYCGFGHDSSSMVSALNSATSHQMAQMDRGGDGTDKVTGHHNSTDENSNSSDCFDCYGSLCHSQSLVSFHFALGLDSSTVALQIEEEINLKFIFPTSLPQPPKQLS